MLYAPDEIADQLRELGRTFIASLCDGHYDHVWNHFIALDGMELVSMASFPLQLYAEGDIDAFLRTPSSVEGMAIVFQQNKTFEGDDIGIRDGFFKAVADGLEGMGWFEGFGNGSSFAFLKGEAAILLADTAGTRRPLLLP